MTASIPDPTLITGKQLLFALQVLDRLCGRGPLGGNDWKDRDEIREIVMDALRVPQWLGIVPDFRGRTVDFESRQAFGLIEAVAEELLDTQLSINVVVSAGCLSVHARDDKSDLPDDVFVRIACVHAIVSAVTAGRITLEDVLKEEACRRRMTAATPDTGSS